MCVHERASGVALSLPLSLPTCHAMRAMPVLHACMAGWRVLQVV